MKVKFKILVSVLLAIAVIAAFWILIRNNSFDVLQPAGTIGDQQRDLIIFASALSAIIVIPVFAMTFWIVWKYRVGHKKPGAYRPEWSKSRLAETIWWGIPIILIGILGVIIWTSSHTLDPYRKLDSEETPLRVQVIALEWKWLFIYPEQNVASVNFLQIPVGRPINFEITSDAPMNSFWIPKLGGQVYAMNGMTTKLHLQAHTPGDYTGKTANISGEGYSGMTFTTRAGSEADFSSWVKGAQQNGQELTMTGYNKLAEPSKNVAPILYSSRPESLYDTVVMKYMMPGHETTHEHAKDAAEGDHHE